MTKICGICGKNRDVRMFAKHNSAKDGFRSHCIDCCRSKRKSGSVLRKGSRENPDSKKAVKALRSVEAEERASRLKRLRDAQTGT